MPVTFKRSGKLAQVIDDIKKNANKTLFIGVDDPEVATYATYLEYGAVQRITGKQRAFFLNQWGISLNWGTISLPPRPMFRTTATANSTKWATIFKNKFLSSLSMEEAYNAVGFFAQQDIVKTIVDGGNSEETFALRSPLTMAIYSAEARANNSRVQANSGGKAMSQTGNPKPLYRTGRLANSIHYNIK